ncbi:MAG: hypothetical protein GY870_03525 [archaeon]|nr:hypothetical protein [archaeon]
MTLVDNEEIEILAYRLYKENETYDKMIWKLAELCNIIRLNIEFEDSHEGNNWCDMNAFKTIEEIKASLKHKELKYPSEQEIRQVAEKLYNHRPEKSRLNWYVAEKTIILEILKNKLEENN